MESNRIKDGMLTTDGRRNADLRWLILLWILIYIPGLGSLEFKGEETRRVLPAVEMLQKGDFLVPYIGGEPYYNKPPMINWLVIGAFKLCGFQNEFSARLPSVMMILLWVIMLMKLPGAWPDHATRFYTGIIFLTNAGMMEKGRLIEIEAVYVCFTGMAVWWWLTGWINGWGAWQMWLGAAVPLALAMLTKGPAHLLFFYAVVIGMAAAQKRWRKLISLEHAGALIVVFGVSGLWYMAAERHVAGDNLGGELSGQFFQRLFDIHYEAGNVFSSLLVSLRNFAPWIVFVPILWNKKLMGTFSPLEKPLFRGLLWGTMVSFVIIILIPGTVGRYSMPAIPMMSLLLGWIISRQDQVGRPEAIWRAILRWTMVLAMILAAVGAVFVWVRSGELFSGLMGMVPLAAALLFGRDMRRNPQTGPIAELMRQTSMVACVFMMQYCLFNPVVAIGFENRRPVAAEINQFAGADEIIYVYRPGHQPFLFYLRQPLVYILTPEQIDGRVNYLLVKESDWSELEKIPAIKRRGFSIIDDFSFRRQSEFKLIRLKEK